MSFSTFFGLRGATRAQLAPRAGQNHHHDPNQPRVPAGHPDGGQWTDEFYGAADLKGTITTINAPFLTLYRTTSGNRAITRLMVPRIRSGARDHDSQRTLSDVVPDSFWLAGARYAQRRPSGRGGPPLGGLLFRLEWSRARADEAVRKVRERTKMANRNQVSTQQLTAKSQPQKLGRKKRRPISVS